MEEKEIIPYNTPEDGVAPTITTMYARLGTNNLTPGEYGGAMGIMEIKSCASRKRGDEHKIETRKDEVANCVTSIDTDSMVCEPTKVIGSMQEHAYQGSVDGVSPCVNAAAGMGGGHIPMVVEEPQIIQKVGDGPICVNPKVNGKQPSVFDRIYSEEGCAVAITSGWLQNVCTKDKNGMEYKGKFIKEGDGLYTNVSKDFIRGGLEGVSRTLKAEKHDAATCIKDGAKYRIRKLTEREVFRLMDVNEEDIDKIQAAGISKTAQYKLAGNSIVVSCLYHIFRKMFIEPGCEEQQLSLF